MSIAPGFIAHFDRDGFFKACFSEPIKIDETLNSLRKLAPKDEVRRLLHCIPAMYEQAQKTWRLGEPIFQYRNNRLGVFFDSSQQFDYVTNIMNGDAYLGKGAGFLKTILEMTFAPIVTNGDGIACDWILNLEQGRRVNTDRLIIFVHTGSDYKANGGFIGACPQRLKTAQTKLKSLGYKTKYFGSINDARKFIEKLKISRGA
jgi:hypothetical protein